MAQKHQIPQNVIDVFKELNLDTAKDGWNCHGSYVLYHRTLEKIAAKTGVTFEPPTIIESDAEKRICVLNVVGHLGDKTEWSIGEAMPINIDKGNNKQAYPYAMAEKRAKDRVIIKLVGLYGAYSQDEADWDAIDAEKKAQAAKKSGKNPDVRMHDFKDDEQVKPLTPPQPPKKQNIKPTFTSAKLWDEWLDQDLTEEDMRGKEDEFVVFMEKAADHYSAEVTNNLHVKWDEQMRKVCKIEEVEHML